MSVSRLAAAACGLSCVVGLSPLSLSLSLAQDLPFATPGELASGLRMGGLALTLSPDGRWVPLATSKGFGFVDVQNGKLSNAGSLARAAYWQVSGGLPAAAWSPREAKLAFGLFRESKWRLTIWNAEDASARELLVNPHKLYMETPPVWSPDGKTLYVRIHQHLPWPKSHPDDDEPPTINENVEVLATAPYGINRPARKRFDKAYPEAYGEDSRSLVIAVDVASGRHGLLLKGNDISGVYPSPDGKHVAVTQGKRSLPGRDARATKQAYTDVYVVPAVAAAQLPAVDLESFDDRTAGWFDHAGRRLAPALENIHLNTTERLAPPVFEGNHGNELLSWSPDGKYFAYGTVGRVSTGDVFVYEIAGKQLRNLTEGVKLQGSDKQLGYANHYTLRYESLRFGHLAPPLWTPDSSALLAIGGGETWLLPLAGQPRVLTAQLPQESVRIAPAAARGAAATDTQGRIVVVAKDRDSRLDSIWTVSLAGDAPRKLADTGAWTNRTLAVDGKGTMLLYTGQGAAAATNLFRIALDAPAQPVAVTSFKPELAERRFPEARVLKWRTAQGRPAYGVLYLPPQAEPGTKLPLIFRGDPGAVTSALDAHMEQGPNFLSNELNELLQDGFAVLRADLPMSDEGVYEEPLKQVVDAVNSAVDATVATGLIDEQRMGLAGVGYGGFMVQAVISQTARFKAAAAVGGTADWVFDYAGGSNARGMRFHEKGAGRMGQPLWTDPARYLENSPLAHFDQVRTPLLLIHGEEDGFAPVAQARESFRALQHLGRTVVYARYFRMSSDPGIEAEQRMRGWFREHLLGDKPVSHLAAQPSVFLGGDQAQDKRVTK